jgi:hypothetical protein
MSSPTATPLPPPNSHPIDAPTDHRSILNVIGWCLAVTTALVVTARLGTKFTVARSFELDDALILVSLVRQLHQK